MKDIQFGQGKDLDGKTAVYYGYGFTSDGKILSKKCSKNI